MDFKEVDKGVNMILKAFNEQKEEYLKVIKELKEKIFMLEEIIAKLKKENNIYQNKLNSLKKNIKSISQTIYTVRDDENFSDEQNSEDNKNIYNYENYDYKMKNKIDNAFFKKHPLKKLEINLSKRSDINFYNKEINDSNQRDDDIQIKKK